MKIYKLYLMPLSLALFIFLFGNYDVPSLLKSQKFNVQAIKMTSGKVISAEPDISLESEKIYKIAVEAKNGGIIEFEFYERTGQLKEIKGHSAPFDYEINPPGNEMIPFSMARYTALNKHSGEIKSWQLKRDPTSGIWYYFIEVTNQQGEELIIKVNNEASLISSVTI